MSLDHHPQSGAARAVVMALRALHQEAGAPSSRTIAAEAGGVSHSTVAAALREDRVPSWPVLQKIVGQLGGDVERFRDLWLLAQGQGAAIAPLPATTTAISQAEVSVFMSYAHVDDRASHGRLVKFAESIQSTYESMTGQQVGIFRDTESIRLGEAWRERISAGLASSSILLAFISPAYLRSAACKEEFWEFQKFLAASSETRLIIPLLFAETARIQRQFREDSVWHEADNLHYIDISELWFEIEGSGLWQRHVQVVAFRIEEMLELAAQTTIRTATEDKSLIPYSDHSETALEQGKFLEDVAELEESAPKLLTDMERVAVLLEGVGHAMNRSSSEMQACPTAKDRLRVANRLAREIDPLADEFEIIAKRLTAGFGAWDSVVLRSIGFARRIPETLNNLEYFAGLEAIRQMAQVGVASLGQLDVFLSMLRQAQGMSGSLNQPLRKMQRATLEIAELRGMFKGWLEGLAMLDTQDDSWLH